MGSGHVLPADVAARGLHRPQRQRGLLRGGQDSPADTSPGGRHLGEHNPDSGLMISPCPMPATAWFGQRLGTRMVTYTPADEQTHVRLAALHDLITTRHATAV